MKNFGLFVFSPILSFIGGILGYMLVLKWVWNQTVGGDLAAVLFYGGVCFILVCFPVYLAVIHYIDDAKGCFIP